MSLRDWFAGQALAGWSETHHGVAWKLNDGPGYGAEGMARAVYAIADAMLAVQAQKPPETQKQPNAQEETP